MSGRGYRVERSSRPPTREPDEDFEPVSRQRSQRGYVYDNSDASLGDSRDASSWMTARSEHGSQSASINATKTTYKVAKERGSDPRVKRSNIVVLDSRLDRDRDLSDWDVIRPERSESGAYVIETSSTSDYASPPDRRRDSSYDGTRRLNLGRDLEILSPPRSQRERLLSRGTLEAIRQVRVTEDYSSDDDHRENRNLPAPRPHTKVEIDAAVSGRAPLQRLQSIIRRDHSPESVTRRRSRSIGFIRDQLSHHDAAESKHERPGAEANVAGRFLIDHRGERIRRKDQDDDDDGALAGGYQARRSEDNVIDTYGAEVERRRWDGRLTERYEEDEYDRRRVPYPPQNHRRRYHRDDDDDKYSEYYDKRTTKKYY